MADTETTHIAEYVACPMCQGNGLRGSVKGDGWACPTCQGIGDLDAELAAEGAWETICPTGEDGAHCDHWYDEAPCCACGAS